MKALLMSDWNLMRVLRLLAGIALLVSAYFNRQTLTGAFGLLFLYQGLFNIRGCGMGACASGTCARYEPASQKNKELIEE